MDVFMEVLLQIRHRMQILHLYGRKFEITSTFSLTRVFKFSIVLSSLSIYHNFLSCFASTNSSSKHYSHFW